MVRRWRGRWAGYGEPRVRRRPRSPACFSSLEISLWIVVFILAGGDLLYAGPLWGMLTMIAIGGIILALVNWIHRRW